MAVTGRLKLLKLTLFLGCFALLLLKCLDAYGGDFVANELRIIANKFDFANGKGIFEGSVRAYVGDIEVLCNKAEAEIDLKNKQVVSFKAFGGVKARLGKVESISKQLDYYISSEEIHLSGDVGVKSDVWDINGDFVVFNVVKQEVTVKSKTGNRAEVFVKGQG